MFLADEYGDSYSVFSCFICEEEHEEYVNRVTVDKVTYNLLDEARDGLPEDINHLENDGFIYVNAVAESMGMDCVEWQMGDFEDNNNIKQVLFYKYRHKVSRKGLEELFKELSSSTEVNDFEYFLDAKGLVK